MYLQCYAYKGSSTQDGEFVIRVGGGGRGHPQDNPNFLQSDAFCNNFCDIFKKYVP